MAPDKLIQGNSYLYKGEQVLYRTMVRLPNERIAHSFRKRHGFVNLYEEQVKEMITTI